MLVFQRVSAVSDPNNLRLRPVPSCLAYRLDVPDDASKHCLDDALDDFPVKSMVILQFATLNNGRVTIN